MIISTYSWIADNGKRIRRASQATFDNGRVIKFTELMSDKETRKQVAYQLGVEAGATKAQAMDLARFLA